jgi:hypothetical protein
MFYEKNVNIRQNNIMKNETKIILEKLPLQYKYVLVNESGKKSFHISNIRNIFGLEIKKKNSNIYCSVRYLFFTCCGQSFGASF